MFFWDFKDCGKSFTNKHSLKRHKVTHDPNKKYKCDICSKAFSLPQYLKEHKIVHTGERPFIWNFPGCGKSFRQAGKLSIHRKEHTSQRKAKMSMINPYTSTKPMGLQPVNYSSLWLSNNLSETWTNMSTLKTYYWLCDVENIFNTNYESLMWNMQPLNSLQEQFNSQIRNNNPYYRGLPNPVETRVGVPSGYGYQYF